VNGLPDDVKIFDEAAIEDTKIIEEEVSPPRRRIDVAAWAPPSLAEFYQTNAAGIFAKEEWRSLTEGLLSDERMREVWTCLATYRSEFDQARIYEKYRHDPALSLWYVCWRIRQDWESVPKLTAAELHEKCVAVEKKAGELADLLQGLELTNLATPTMLMDGDAIKELADSLKIDDWKVEELVGPNSLLVIVPGIAPRYVAGLINIAFQSTRDMMLRMQEIAQLERQLAFTVSQPNSERAELRYFVDELSLYFQRVYKRPLDERVATIASFVFGSEVESDMVRRRRTDKRRQTVSGQGPTTG